jgi:colanic acid biosynthesis glycosyl transferase WcaI
VRVIAAPPHFPDWRRTPGAGGGGWRWDRVDGLAILRCPTYVPARPTCGRRLLQQASFALAALPAVVGQVWRWRPDALLVVAPALAAAPGALLAARVAGVPAWLHLQDLELDAAFELGLLPAALRRPAAAAERALLRGFDRVTTISAAMRARLEAKGAPAHRLGVVANGVDLRAIRAVPPGSAAHAGLRVAFGLPADALVALYAGSLGRKQGAEVLLATARQLADRSDLRLLVVSSGPAADELRRAAAGLPGLILRDLVPAAQLGALLACADLHLLPQDPAAADLVLPSKLPGMLASGRAVVAAAPAGTALADAIAGCGVALPANDPALFARAIRALAAAPERRHALGAAARARAERSHDAALGLDAAEAILQALAPSAPPDRSRRVAWRRGRAR